MRIERNLYKILDFLYDRPGSWETKLVLQGVGITEVELLDVIRIYTKAPHIYLNGNENIIYITSEGKLWHDNFHSRQEKENLEMQKLRVDVQLMTDTLADYPNVKRNAKLGVRFSIISIILTAIATIIACVALTKK